MNQLEKTLGTHSIHLSKQSDEKWINQLQTISCSLKNLKTTQERNNYIKHVQRQRVVDKMIQEKQIIQQKSSLLNRSKKKFLSLIRCKDSESFFMKFKPIQKPLNMLRMVSELNLAERVQQNLAKDIADEEITKIVRVRNSDHQSKSKESTITESRLKPRKTLESLIQDQTKYTLQNDCVKIPKKKEILIKKSHSQYSKSSLSQLMKTDTKTIETQLSQILDQDDEKQSRQTQKLQKICKVPSQILARNGIYLHTKNSVNSIKVNSQNKVCLEDDNSSLASHTELMLDSIYGSTQQLKQDTKNFEGKKKEYEHQTIKLFYKKIYCKI